MEPAPEYQKTASLCESQNQLSNRFSPAGNEQCLVQLCASCPMLRRSLACSCRFQKGLDALPCLPDTRGALQPAASRAMQMQATRAFHTMLPDKMNFSIIIVIIVMQLVSLCRRTPFMISSFHVTKVMMMNMIMTTRKGCGSLCNLYASAVGHLS